MVRPLHPVAPKMTGAAIAVDGTGAKAKDHGIAVAVTARKEAVQREADRKIGQSAITAEMSHEQSVLLNPNPLRDRSNRSEAVRQNRITRFGCISVRELLRA